MKKIATILALCLSICVLFCACGQGGSGDLASEIEGTWSLTTIVDAEGNESTLAEYCEANGVDSMGMEAAYTFAADGAGTASIGGIGMDITYEVSGSSVSVTANGQTFSMSYENGTLVSEANGMKSIFTK